MLSNAYFLAKFRFDTAENEPAKNLQIFEKCIFEKGQVIGDALRAAAKLGAVGALVCTDGASYGGTHGDLRAACAMSDALGGPGPDRFPIVAKDLIYVFSNSELERIFSNFCLFST